MLIRSWGSRGSIAVSGREYLKYGGDTTCIEVVSKGGDLIIIDAGTGIRRLGMRLVDEKRLCISIILTHPHWDHLCGFPFFKPLYQKKSVIDVRGPRTTQNSLRRIISKTMSAPYFPVELDDIHAKIRFHSTGPGSFRIGTVKITTIPINHPNPGVGYRLEEGGKTFIFLTDNELGHPHPHGAEFKDYVGFSKGADLLFHDAEFLPGEYKHTKGWGHSVYLETLKLAMEAGVKKLGLFHHNQDRTDDGVDRIKEDCLRIIAKKKSPLKCLAVAAGTEIEL